MHPPADILCCPTMPQDWRALAKFNDTHYVRHLVDENGDFEMIVSAGEVAP